MIKIKIQGLKVWKFSLHKKITFVSGFKDFSLKILADFEKNLQKSLIWMQEDVSLEFLGLQCMLSPHVSV